MLFNYLKIAWRNLVKGKIYSVINITGLAVGIACCLLIGLYVFQELRYDRFNKHSDRIFRANYVNEYGNGITKLAQTPVPLAPFLKQNVPDIDKVVRLSKRSGVVRVASHQMFDENFLVAGKDFFKIFSFRLSGANPERVMSSRNQVLLTTSAARKYFHSTNVIGKPIELRIDGTYYQAQVGSIVDEPPVYSSVQFNVIVPLEFWKKVDSDYAQGDNWGTFRPATYVMVSPGVPASQLTAKVNHLLQHKLPDQFIKNKRFSFEPISDIHFDQFVQGTLEPTASKAFVLIAVGIALLILIIACINFTSLSIGHSVRRAREVGMRKVMGAVRGQLIGQFWGETLLVVLISLVLGLGLTELLKPYFTKLIDKPIMASWYSNPILIIVIGGIVLLTALLAGSYPALYLSKFRPAQAFRNKIHVEGKHTLIRVLTTLQFMLAVILIISTIFMNRQMNFLMDKNLGYNQDRVIQIDVPFKEGRGIMERLRSRLENESGVKAISGGWKKLGKDGSFDFNPATSGDQKVKVYSFGMDSKMPKLLQLKVLKGHYFRKGLDLKSPKKVLVNEQLVNAFGWANPVGKHISKRFEFNDAQVIGVVKDFNFQSMHRKIGPLVIYPMSYVSSVYVRLRGGAVNSNIQKVQKAWSESAPGLPFDFTFLDQQIQQQYQSDQRWAEIVNWASVIAIVIACMGLFGLAALASAKRSKELSIRKVLGATVTSLVRLLSKDFLKPVLMGLLLAVPLTYLLVRWWLQNFAYRITMDAGTFIWAGLLIVVIAIFTVSWQTIRAALVNPAESLRNE